MPRVQYIIACLLMVIPFLGYAQQETFPLYSKEAPNTKALLEKDVIGNGGRIERVAVPQITVYRPQKTASNGKAILICPGGGYGIIAIQHEGHQIARWYSDRGYTAAVLKYRLPEEDLLNESWEVPLMDAEEGIRFLRKRAKKWHYDSDKIGVLGFSAGGHLASSVSVHNHAAEGKEPSSRPDFSVLIYPVISMDTSVTHQGSRRNLLGEKLNTDLENYFSNETQINHTTPPAFLVHSWDDTAVPPENSIRYAKALNQKGIKCELHLFEKGGHGYGRGNIESHGNASTWLEMSDQWISDLFSE
ncbi:alpha/beta hydrolase [Echinicola marina]|uniref:alpha/beta hydrolase n=1 Tax=Echinicola marina TaxID=2859768 RepID=UPI001CF635AF|nr:alpha/beta hydrolase [Echinicola marina]UCS94915.1 alpha/beta hydrolase [Echinicola marina]